MIVRNVFSKPEKGCWSNYDTLVAHQNPQVTPTGDFDFSHKSGHCHHYERASVCRQSAFLSI